MSEEAPYSIPVAAVPSNWLRTTFFPQIESSLAMEDIPVCPVWMPVDSGHEAEYLISKTSARLRESGRTVRELELAEHDPLVLWHDLFGGPDVSGLWNSLPPQSVILVRGGYHLPLDFLQQFYQAMASLIRTFSWIIVLPVYRKTYRHLDPSMSPSSLIKVPPLIDVSSSDLMSLCRHSCKDRLPLITAGDLEDLAKRLTEARPTSRRQLERWIDFYARGGDETEDFLESVRQSPPPPSLNPRERDVPPLVARRDELAEGYRASLAKLRRADANFYHWCGGRLALDRAAADPFQSPDPSYWFTACVSAIYILLFDGPSNNLSFISTYRLDRSTADLVWDVEPSLFDIADALRTYFQHSLNEHKAGDSRKLNMVRSWFRTSCGTDSPKKHHARCLTSALLSEWDVLTSRLVENTSRLDQVPSSKTIHRSWRERTRELNWQDVRDLFATAASEIAPNVLAGTLADRHCRTVLTTLKKAPVQDNQIMAFALDMARRLTAEEVGQCPIGAPHLIDLGVVQGPALGRLLTYIRSQWLGNPTLTEEALMLRARLKVGRYAVQRRNGERSRAETHKHRAKLNRKVREQSSRNRPGDVGRRRPTLTRRVGVVEIVD